MQSLLTPPPPQPRPEGQAPTDLNKFGASIAAKPQADQTGGMNVGQAASLTATAAQIGSLIAQLTGNQEIARYISLAANTAQGAKAISSLLSSGAGGVAGAANITGVVQAIMGALQASGVIEPSRDSAAITKGISTALMATQAALSGTGVGAVIASAINTGLGLYSDISAGRSAENTLVNAVWNSSPFAFLDLGGGMNEQINEAFMPSAEWRTFGKYLGRTLGMQSTGLGGLYASLPYVQSKEELGQLIDAYKKYIATGGGYTGEVGGYGVGSKPYEIPGLPGAGGTRHEWNIQFDNKLWGPAQVAINDLLKQLPGSEYAGGSTLDPNSPAGQAWSYYSNPRRVQGGAYNQTKLFEAAEAPQATWDYISAHPGTALGQQVSDPGSDNSLGGYGRTLTPGMEGYDYSLPGAAPNISALPVTPYWQSLLTGNPVPGTPDYMPSPQFGTIGQTGGSRIGIGGAQSPLVGGQPAQVSPDITQGVQQKQTTGFVSPQKVGAV